MILWLIICSNVFCNLPGSQSYFLAFWIADKSTRSVNNNIFQR